MAEQYLAELTNMIMIEDGNGKVLVQKRKKYWTGIAFPGGHVEPGESLEASVIREAKEETGLTVKSPVLCGVIHWDNPQKREKYMVFAYKASKFEGTLIEKTDEGAVFWVDKKQLCNMELCENFASYLKVFEAESGKEFFNTYS